MKKRVFVYLLAILMVLTVFNGFAYAEEVNEEEIPVVEDNSEEVEGLELSDENIEDAVEARYYYGREFSNISVSRYYVSGYTDPNATVNLYCSAGNYIASAQADSDGYFSIYYPNDLYYNYYDLEGAYLTSTNGTSRSIYSSDLDWDYWDGRYYDWYDWRYRDSDYGYYDSYGNWHYYDWYLNDRYGCWKDGSWCWYDRYNNPDFGYWENGKWYYYDWYYNSDYGYWKDGTWYWYNWYNDDDYGYWRDGRWYWYDRYIYNPVASEAAGGTDYVRGYGAGPYGDVIVRDYNDNFLGSTTANSDGTFFVETNRSLVPGETLKVTTSYRNRLNDYTTITVSGSSRTFTNNNYTNVFTIGSKTYTSVVNGVKETKTMDVTPYTENGKTMLPLRYIADSLGYEVTYDNNTKNAVFIKGSSAIVINLYSKDFTVDGKTYSLSTEPKTVNGRIMLPVSEIAKALGLDSGNLGSGKAIEWDNLNKQVIISTRR